MELGNQIAMTIAAVAMLRKYLPQIDGWMVLVATLFVAVGAVLGTGQTGTALEIACRVATVAIGSLGGVRFAQVLIDRHASKVSASDVDVTNDIEPVTPPKGTPVSPPGAAVS